jgi:hypothetical protein
MEELKMKKTLVIVGVGLVMLFAAGVALALDQIVNIHVNDANGVPVAPYAVGTTVNIRGIITAEFTTASVSYSRGFIQDETGGINYYYTGTHVCFALGDDVSITGTIAQYNGMTEVMISSYTINSHGNPLPAPKLITVADLIGTFQADYTEPDEGRLVKISNVTIPGASGSWSSKNWSINDGVNTDTLYVYGGAGCAVHPLIGTPVPTGLFCVIGILSQFDANSPYLSGYQISPRMLPDITVGPTAVENATWGRIKSLFR